MLGENIRKAREAKGLTQKQLAEIIGAKNTSISNWEKGLNKPDADMLAKICGALDVDANYLLGHSSNKKYNYLGNFSIVEGTVYEKMVDYTVDNPEVLKVCEDNPDVKTVTFVPIPVLGIIRAGEPILAQQNIIGYEYMPESMLNGKEYFGLLVRGDSMNNARIHDRDVVIVKVQPEVENGEIAVVLVNGEDATIKKFYKTDTMVTLMPDSTNKEHQPRFIDIRKEEVRVLGKVVRFIGRV